MFSILNRALSWAITSFGNKFSLKKRSRLIKALDDRFYIKFMQLEIGLLLRVFEIFSNFEKQKGVYKLGYKSCCKDVYIFHYKYECCC